MFKLKNFKETYGAIVFAILNVFFIVGLILGIYFYINRSNESIRNQNINEVNSINEATSKISLDYINSQTTALVNLLGYAQKSYKEGSLNKVSEFVNFFYDGNYTHNVTYEIVDKSYNAYISEKDTAGTFLSGSYKHADYAKLRAIFDNAKIEEGITTHVSGEFSDQFSTFKSFAIYSYMLMKDDSGVEGIYTVMQITRSDTFKSLVAFNRGYDKLFSVLIDKSGYYIFSNSYFKNDNFYDYLMVYNGLTLEKRNELRDTVLNNNEGYFLYTDYHGHSCIFVYYLADSTRGWYSISVTPISSFQSFNKENNIYSYIIYFILIITILTDVLWFAMTNIRIKKAYEKAQQASLAKSEFLSRMSHDIRTPLNGIIGLTDIIINTKKLDPETLHYEEEVITSSNFLLGLLNDILDMSRIEANKMELVPEPYYKDEIIRYLESVVMPLCNKKGINFTYRFDCKDNLGINIDKQRINQVVFNLLSNSVKFTPKGGHILASFALYKKPNTLFIEVSDDGQGMSKEFQKKMFDTFTQEKRNESVPGSGSGLGLSIVYSLVKLMKGSIDVVSDIGEGTKFSIAIPISEVLNASQKPAEVEYDTSMLKGLHVLLAEDNSLNREIALVLLKEKGMIVDTAEDGVIGLKMFMASKEHTYDAILMDIRMPHMGGLEASENIRKLERSDNNIPIIAMSADAFEESFLAAKAVGINGYITKPIIPEKMFEELSRLIK